jgi:hypothetical protein
MKVYGVYYGCIYEGGGVQGELYLDKEKAIKVCEELVIKEQKERDDQFEHSNKDEFDIMYHEDYKWIRDNEYNENYWTNSVDCICIQEFEVIE